MNASRPRFGSSILVPEQCSAPFQRIIEALFITHAETRLNTIGHLDGTNDPTNTMLDRGDWCRDLHRNRT